MNLFVLKIYIVLVCFVFSSFTLLAQTYVLTGKVVNARTDEVLSFVNISINKGQAGTTSDIDGNFRLEINFSIQSITFSYIGFETFVYNVTQPDDIKPLLRPLTIRLNESSKELKEIVIKAGENPAHRIIRSAVNNRSINDPDRLRAFSYQAYNKFFMTVENAEEEKKDTALIARAKSVDSSDLQVLNMLEKQHLFVMESIIERKYKSPDLDKETILAQKLSGFKHPFFAALGSSVKPFSFYKDYLDIFGKAYLNPVSKNSTEKYYFELQEKLPSGQDTVFVIAFTPLPDKNIEGLEGIVYIHSRTFALQNFIVDSPKDVSSNISFHIEQRYQEIGEDWFPSQLLLDLVFQRLTIGEQKTLGSIRSYLRNVETRSAIQKNDYDEVTLEVKNDALEQAEEYWKQYRAIPLNAKEQKTYAYMDSLGKKQKLDRVGKFIEVVATGKLTWGFIDFDINQAIRINRYEGLRLNMAAISNEKLHPWLQFSAFVGFGTKDKDWKYGLGTQADLLTRFDLKAGVFYSRDVQEPGRSRFLIERNLLSGTTIREFLTERMDRIQNAGAYLSGKPYRNMEMRLGLEWKQVYPGFDYSFVNIKGEDRADTLRNYNLGEFSVRLNYSFGKQYLRVGRHKIFTGNKLPVLSFNYTHGGNFLNGDFSYNRYEIQFWASQRFRNAGTTSLYLEGALTDSPTPYALLFNGNALTRQQPVFVGNFFQTMELYEFLSSRLMQVFLSHNFGKLLFKSPLRFMQPELMLVQGFAIGSLIRSESHLGISFKTLHQPYYESGFLIRNIFLFDYLDVAKFGIGVGLFFRYGPQAKDSFGKNLFPRLSMGFSF